MSIVYLVFTATGSICWAYVIFYLLVEMVRSARQSYRLCRVHAHRDGRRKTVRLRTFFRMWNKEAFRSYSSMQIGPFNIPYDPNERIRRSYYF